MTTIPCDRTGVPMYARPWTSYGTDFMSNSSGPPLHLLIVDDDDQLREIMTLRFRRDGMAVTAAASGEEALALAAQERWDVALLDLHLPGMTGIDLVGRLKE